MTSITISSCPTCASLRLVLASAERNADRDPATFAVAQAAYCYHVTDCPACQQAGRVARAEVEG